MQKYIKPQIKYAPIDETPLLSASGERNSITVNPTLGDGQAYSKENAVMEDPDAYWAEPRSIWDAEE